ncbi:MAG: SagB/ThcOx family dehydrogenase [Prevotellaceae bacterium]|jgi:nitroreductase|nr:SagB/ThcOx family dehydrogenase [Prevotellaceae bacterium]
MKKKAITILGGLFMLVNVSAQDISLPDPQKTGGMPLMETLSKRSSHREFSSVEIDNQTLSNLLWAAWGYNRADKRTAPSANDKQELELYVVKKSGAYLYDARANKLIQVNKEDVRKDTGKQDFVGNAPVNIIFVAKNKNDYSPVNAGFISQNIYLYCASADLGTVVRGFFEPEKVSKALKLKDTEIPVLTQTVGKKK